MVTTCIASSWVCFKGCGGETSRRSKQAVKMWTREWYPHVRLSVRGKNEASDARSFMVIICCICIWHLLLMLFVMTSHCVTLVDMWTLCNHVHIGWYCERNDNGLQPKKWGVGILKMEDVGWECLLVTNTWINYAHIVTIAHKILTTRRNHCYNCNHEEWGDWIF